MCSYVFTQPLGHGQDVTQGQFIFKLKNPDWPCICNGSIYHWK